MAGGGGKAEQRDHVGGDGAAGRTAGGAATPGKRSLTGAIQGLGAGTPPGEDVRAPVEQRFGVSLADVRVHDSPEANALAAEQGARAFAFGADVVLGAGESATDRQLMAPELTHVLQQRGGGQQLQAAGGPAGAAEDQANHVAGDVAAGPPGRIVEAWVLPSAGQLAKPAFLDLAHQALIAMVDQELGVIGRASACPYLQMWFSKNILRPVADIERFAQQFTGITVAADAREYLEPAVARVRSAARPIHDSAMRLILTTTPSPKINAGMYQWDITLPDDHRPLRHQEGRPIRSWSVFPTAMSDAFSIAGDFPGASFSALRAALVELGVPIRVHREIDIEWCEPGIDLNFEAVLRPDSGADYLLTGSIEAERATAIERLRALADVLQGHGIVYQLELDDQNAVGGRPVVTLSHPDFPGYPH